MTKNESDILKYRIPYHGKIFGFENIHIIDNGSTDDTKDLCLKYKTDYTFFDGDFNLKADKLTNLINKHRKNCDIVIPLDSDEFISVKNGDVWIFDDRIVEYFKDFIDAKNSCKFRLINAVETEYDYDNPLIDMHYFYECGYHDMAKIFMPSKICKGTDGGNHCGVVSSSQGKPPDALKIKLFHFAFRGFTHFCRKIKQGGEAFGAHKMDRRQRRRYKSTGCQRVCAYDTLVEEVEKIEASYRQKCKTDTSKLSYITEFSEYITSLEIEKNDN